MCFRDVLALPIFKQEEPQLSPENEAKLPPFQYVLCTATSPAVKLHEETLTYLNQGRVCTAWRRAHFLGMIHQREIEFHTGASLGGQWEGEKRERDGEGMEERTMWHGSVKKKIKGSSTDRK